MEEKQVHYGKMLQNLIKQHGISVRELSEILGKTTQAIYNIFRTKSPRMDVVVEISRAVGIDVFNIELKEDVRQIRAKSEFHTEYFTKIIEDRERIINERIKENRTFYESYLKKLEDRLAAVDQSLALANKVIDAKDELIAQLRKDN